MQRKPSHCSLPEWLGRRNIPPVQRQLGHKNITSALLRRSDQSYSVQHSASHTGQPALLTCLPTIKILGQEPSLSKVRCVVFPLFFLLLGCNDSLSCFSVLGVCRWRLLALLVPLCSIRVLHKQVVTGLKLDKGSFNPAVGVLKKQQTEHRKLIMAFWEL